MKKKKKVVRRNSHHPTVESMATITTNNDIQKKSILISRTSDNSPKSPSRNVRFAPEITLNNEQVILMRLVDLFFEFPSSLDYHDKCKFINNGK